MSASSASAEFTGLKALSSAVSRLGVCPRFRRSRCAQMMDLGASRNEAAIHLVNPTFRHGRAVVIPEEERETFGEVQRELHRVLPLMVDVDVRLARIA